MLFKNGKIFKFGKLLDIEYDFKISILTQLLDSYNEFDIRYSKLKLIQFQVQSISEDWVEHSMPSL